MTNYTLIATFAYPSELTVAKTLLEANNIPYLVKDELTVQVHNFYSNAIGGIKLEVPDARAQEAIDILIDSGYENFVTQNEELSNEQRLKRQQYARLLKIIISVMFSLGLAVVVWLLYYLISQQ
ncbi:putative signal transducing protein [Mangrovimonas sp. YM274]|uniref:putative signal transducing protein n=1 Tax=Mangrovimonas sp. YM274 TaxID=3070660 RepID=UPI0027DBFCEA|nr:DUF2007 domain-containing protein [Mangrovimonas sp. YM274]WMI68992.1 DUF2007 domain-containing protein [Mangrovimonas sp. YM274]